MIDTADLYARCSQLFDYARGQSDVVSGAPLRVDITSALRQTGIWEDASPACISSGNNRSEVCPRLKMLSETRAYFCG